MIALAAAALLLLRPVCDLWHAYAGSAAPVAIAAAIPEGTPPGHGHAHQPVAPVAPCCQYASDAGISAALQAATAGSGWDPEPPAPPSIALAAIAIAFTVGQAFRRRAVPRSPQSFYLRSARILR